MFTVALNMLGCVVFRVERAHGAGMGTVVDDDGKCDTLNCEKF
jgi:hypothetical protein